jgi:hypothetical protein
MGGDTASQGRQVVTPFQSRDKVTVAMLFGNASQSFGDPVKVGFHQVELGHIVFSMSIETSRDHNQFWPKMIDSVEPTGLDNGPERFASGPRGKGQVDDVITDSVCPHIWVERVLEAAAEQDPGIITEDILGAITMMHIKIDDRNATELISLQCMGGTYRNIIEYAKTHGLMTFCMMSRGAYVAEGSSHLSMLN